MIHLNKISLTQLACLVTLTQVGVHVLTIPYEESRVSGYDAWMSVLLGGLFAQAIILVIYRLGKRFPGRPFPSYVSSIVGKPLGAVVNVLLAFYCAESAMMVVISYADVIGRWVLFTTPWPVLIGMSFAVAGFIASSSFRSIATITQTILLVFLVCLFIVFVSGTGKGDMRHFLPVGSHGFGAILKDALPATWAYAGFELLLYAYPYVQFRKRRDIFVAVSVANGITTSFYLLISGIVLYNFSESQLNVVTEPMVYILRQFKWPVVKSLDILFMIAWLAVTTVTVYVYLFLSARYLAFVGRKESRRHALISWTMAVGGFALALRASDRQWILGFSGYHNTSTLIMTAALPAAVYLVALARRKAESA